MYADIPAVDLVCSLLMILYILKWYITVHGVNGKSGGVLTSINRPNITQQPDMKAQLAL